MTPEPAQREATPSPLSLIDEIKFTEACFPDHERQLAFLRPAVSMPVLPKSRVFLREHDDQRVEKLAYDGGV